MRRRLARSTALTSLFATFVALIVVAAPTAQAATARIEGSGSSWAANAVNQWIADVESSGLQVVFTSQGSAQGRKDFANRTTDYAVSDIGFRGTDQVTGDQDTNQGRPYAYLPIVAGGTSFPYNLQFGGRQIRDLRLSGETLAKIFTNQITNWSDDAITADNNGRRMPNIPIIPLVHAEGSGSTAQLTTYFDTVYPGIWRPYNRDRAGFTEYYPVKEGTAMLAQNGSDQIINYVTSGAANGVITYDEYSYALAKDFPVVKVLNASGYYTLPTQYNVAVALQKARINMDKDSPDYLLQDLREVFGYTDPRTYPLSSYSYMIIPTGADDPRMSTAKRQTLVDYLYYSVCGGQKAMGPIGYSPLPINLVQASFEQTNKLKDADPEVDIDRRDPSTCNNPTFVAGEPTRNYLAEIAPQPVECDRAGAGPCVGGADEAINDNPVGGEAPAASTGGDAGAQDAAPVGEPAAAQDAAAPGGDPAAGGSAGGVGAPGAGATPQATGSAVGIAGVKTTVDKKTGAVSTTVVDPGTGKQVAATVDAATGLVTTTITDAKTGEVSVGVVDAATGKVSKATVDPLTGQVVAPAGTAGVGGGAAGSGSTGGVGGSSTGVARGIDGQQIAVPTDLAAMPVSDSVIGSLTMALLLLAIALPPLIARSASLRAASARPRVRS